MKKTFLIGFIFILINNMAFAKVDLVNYQATFGLFGTVGTIKNKIPKQLSFGIELFFYFCLVTYLHIKSKMHNIAVLHNVFFSFDTHFACLFTCRFRTKRSIVFKLNYFCTYKTFFKIGMNNTGGLWCSISIAESPGANLFFTSSEISFEVQNFIGKEIF